MFRPTAPLQKMLRRLPLSPKQAGKDYYKGNGVGSMGTITKHGKFMPDYEKIRTYVYPARGTDNAELTPFVGASIAKTMDGPDGKANYDKKFTGEDYLNAWKLNGGRDYLSQPERNMPEVFEEKPGKKEP